MTLPPPTPAAAARIVARYKDGATLEDLVRVFRTGEGHIRRVLAEAGVLLRTRGGGEQKPPVNRHG